MTKRELLQQIKNQTKIYTKSAKTDRIIWDRMKGTKEYYNHEALCKQEQEDYISASSQCRREYHLAYCLFKGRTIEQIEPNRRSDRAYEHKMVDYGAKCWLDTWNSQITEEPTNE